MRAEQPQSPLGCSSRRCDSELKTPPTGRGREGGLVQRSRELQAAHHPQEREGECGHVTRSHVLPTSFLFGGSGEGKDLKLKKQDTYNCSEECPDIFMTRRRRARLAYRETSMPTHLRTGHLVATWSQDAGSRLLPPPQASYLVPHLRPRLGSPPAPRTLSQLGLTKLGSWQEARTHGKEWRGEGGDST